MVLDLKMYAKYRCNCSHNHRMTSILSDNTRNACFFYFLHLPVLLCIICFAYCRLVLFKYTSIYTCILCLL